MPSEKRQLKPDASAFKRPLRDPLGLISGPEENFPGADYSNEETAFLLAMERYKRERRRPFPTWREVLHVAHTLGYRKTAD